MNEFKTEEMYRSIFENAIEGIFQTTPAGQYLNVNPALATMYGYDSVQDLIAGLTKIENQLYVAMSGTVGNLPEVPYMSNNYGQAAILTPSDYFFARDGIANEGIVNQEQMIISDVDLQLLDEQRITGSVIPLTDLIEDAYDHVIHSVDRRSDGAANLPGYAAAR